MQNEARIGDPRKDLDEIFERINSINFDIPLRCPRCSGHIENYSCPRCAVKPDESVVRITKTFSGISAVLSVILPLFGAGLIYAVTRSKVLMVIGFVIGAGLGRAMAAMDAQGAKSAKSRVAPDLLLAQEYQKNEKTFDAAAICYLHWLRAQDFPWPPKEMTAFLWRYRYATSVNERLRQTLLDTAFYKTWSVLVRQSSGYTSDRANLMYAAANDSDEQVNIAKAVWAYCSGCPLLAKLLVCSAPVTAALFAGEKAPEKIHIEPGQGAAIRYLRDEFWPNNIIQFKDIPDNAHQLRFTYQKGQRLVGISDSMIMVGWIDVSAFTATTTVDFSEPLANVKRVVEEWSSDGNEFRGIWFFSGDHAYNFEVPDGFTQLLKAANAIPGRIQVEAIRPIVSDTLILKLRFVRNIFIVTVVALFIGFISRPTSNRGFYCFMAFCASGVALMITSEVIKDNRKGSRKNFLAACGIQKIRDLADPSTRLPG